MKTSIDIMDLEEAADITVGMFRAYMERSGWKPATNDPAQPDPTYQPFIHADHGCTFTMNTDDLSIDRQDLGALIVSLALVENRGFQDLLRDISGAVPALMDSKQQHAITYQQLIDLRNEHRHLETYASSLRNALLATYSIVDPDHGMTIGSKSAGYHAVPHLVGLMKAELDKAHALNAQGFCVYCNFVCDKAEILAHVTECLKHPLSVANDPDGHAMEITVARSNNERLRHLWQFAKDAVHLIRHTCSSMTIDKDGLRHIKFEAAACARCDVESIL